MDYKKIGYFIMNERKAKNLTQAKLAEKLFVSEKTISKWENGNGVPDTNTLPKLCEVFEITLNELLNGERISTENYTSKAENTLLELQTAKVEKDKMLLMMEIVIGVMSAIVLFSFTLFAALFAIKVLFRVLLIIFGFVISSVGFYFALKIEQVAGYYSCKHCGNKFVPTFKQVNLAMHMGRTRYMKCPHCNQKSWCKKVLK